VVTNLWRVTAFDAHARRSPGRRSAADRREEIVGIALRHFAEGGYRGTSTEAIAREAGISQPYLFRLFRTKKELFLAASGAMTARVRETFERAAEGLPEQERLAAMGAAYLQLLQDRTMLRMQLQCHAAAAADPEIQERARDEYASVMQTVRELSGADADALAQFMAKGMFLNVLAALELDPADLTPHS
jgi:AcrR family transcriptional regulator